MLKMEGGMLDGAKEVRQITRGREGAGGVPERGDPKAGEEEVVDVLNLVRHRSFPRAPWRWSRGGSPVSACCRGGGPRTRCGL